TKGRFNSRWLQAITAPSFHGREWTVRAGVAPEDIDERLGSMPKEYLCETWRKRHAKRIPVTSRVFRRNIAMLPGDGDANRAPTLDQFVNRGNRFGASAARTDFGV